MTYCKKIVLLAQILLLFSLAAKSSGLRKLYVAFFLKTIIF
jgi:hypothetical protein